MQELHIEVDAGVAQWLESLPSKQIVVGSSPIACSIFLEYPFPGV